MPLPWFRRKRTEEPALAESALEAQVVEVPTTVVEPAETGADGDESTTTTAAKKRRRGTRGGRNRRKTGTAAAELETADKIGYKLPLLARHPLMPGKTLPVYAANFVLMEYGTGAIFGCPGHDERDHEFATKYGLPIIPVVHSEGSGDSFQLTSYMLHQYASLYQPYGGSAPTEYYFRKGSQVAENGSDSVMNFISSAAANAASGGDKRIGTEGAAPPGSEGAARVTSREGLRGWAPRPMHSWRTKRRSLRSTNSAR